MNFDKQANVKSLYIHWPFCPYRCHFCPFLALAGQDEQMPAYHKALTEEILSFAQQLETKPTLDTIFFGGGTPSTYPENLLLDTFGILKNKFNFSKDIEITLEVNPGTVTLEKLKTWKSAGINRLSIGVQSLNNDVLKKLNRHQKAEDVFFLINNADGMFNSLSVDLIVGLPGISEEEWKATVEQIVKLPIKHISMYFLTVHEDTPLYFGVKTNKINLPSEDSVVDLYYWTVEKFKQNGFNQYEISNFAKPEYECKHNTVYWTRKPYKGFGLGACSFDGKARLQNQKNLKIYLEGQNDSCFYELLNEKQIWLENLMLELRQTEGILIDNFLKDLSEKEKSNFLSAIDGLSNTNLTVHENNRLKLKPAGLAVVNEIIIKLSNI